MRVVGTVDKDARIKLDSKVLPTFKDDTGSRFFSGELSVLEGASNVQFDIEATDFQTPPNTLTKRYSSPATWGLQKSYQYDLNGNLVAEYAGPVKSRAYKWDALDRLIEIDYTPEDATDKSRTEFVYDSVGRRSIIREYDAGDTETEARRFVWVGLRITQERDSAGLVVKRFLGSGFTSGSSATPAGAEKHFYTRDHLGSTRQVVTGLGSLAAAYEYSPYGIATKLSGTLVKLQSELEKGGG